MIFHQENWNTCKTFWTQTFWWLRALYEPYESGSIFKKQYFLKCKNDTYQRLRGPVLLKINLTICPTKTFWNHCISSEHGWYRPWTVFPKEKVVGAFVCWTQKNYRITISMIKFSLICLWCKTSAHPIKTITVLQKWIGLNTVKFSTGKRNFCQ